MKKYFIPATVVIIITLFASCQGNQKNKKEPISDPKAYVKDNPGVNAGVGTYSIDAPENWIKKDTNMSGAKFTTITSPLEGTGDNFRENVNVITEAAKGYDHNEYADANLKSMKIQMPEVNVISQEEIQIGGLQAKAIVYSVVYGEYDLQNTVYFLTKNDIGYVITCTAIKSKFSKFQPEFKTCVNSFIIAD
jgi:hypothetical protein